MASLCDVFTLTKTIFQIWFLAGWKLGYWWPIHLHLSDQIGNWSPDRSPEFKQLSRFLPSIKLKLKSAWFLMEVNHSGLFFPAYVNLNTVVEVVLDSKPIMLEKFSITQMSIIKQNLAILWNGFDAHNTNVFACGWPLLIALTFTLRFLLFLWCFLILILFRWCCVVSALFNGVALQKGNLITELAWVIIHVIHQWNHYTFPSVAKSSCWSPFNCFNEHGNKLLFIFDLHKFWNYFHDIWIVKQLLCC